MQECFDVDVAPNLNLPFILVLQLRIKSNND